MTNWHQQLCIYGIFIFSSSHYNSSNYTHIQWNEGHIIEALHSDYCHSFSINISTSFHFIISKEKQIILKVIDSRKVHQLSQKLHYQMLPNTMITTDAIANRLRIKQTSFTLHTITKQTTEIGCFSYKTIPACKTV